MGKYLVVKYYTFTGIKSLIDLGDFSYGEWIIYEGGIAKYHVDVMDQNDKSNIIINSLMNKYNETIDSIIKKINLKHNKKLLLESRCLIEFVKESILIDLNLEPLPEHWVENLLL